MICMHARSMDDGQADELLTDQKSNKTDQFDVRYTHFHHCLRFLKGTFWRVVLN